MMGHLRLTLAGAMICAACLATCPLGAQTQQLVESCGKGENALSARQRSNSARR